MTGTGARASAPVRWRLAAWMGGCLPDVRGRDRVTARIRGNAAVDRPLRGRLVNGIRYEFPSLADGSVASLVSLRHAPPALAPALDVLLRPGGCFYDVGANIGIYALWGSRLVGDGGEVHAFEPVPDTAVLLRTLIRTNGATNVTVVDAACDATSGQVHLATVPGASGLARVAPDGTVAAAAVSLDEYMERHRAPDVVKIDVEGHELGVLRGAGTVLTERRPAVLLEVLPAQLERTGSTYAQIRALLSGHGYALYDLTRHGVRDTDPARPSSNVLALHGDRPEHRHARAALDRVRFARNQTT